MDPYAVLGVAPDATPAEIKRAWRALAQQLHPDKNDAPDAAARFQEAQEAWTLLSDPARRGAWDAGHGRVGPGQLPAPFLDDIHNAIERAQGWIERAVLPHYARFYRGRGAEMAARLVQDLERLADPTQLVASTTWQSRRRARRLARQITVSIDPRPSSTTTWLRRRPGPRWHIHLAPQPLHAAGFRDPGELDDAVLRLLLARYVQVIAAGRFAGDPLAHPDPVAAGRLVDTGHLQVRALQGTVVLGLAGIVAAMLTAGYLGW